MARIWVFEMHGPESLTPSPNACKYCDIVSHYNVRQYSTVMQPLQDFASRVDWLAPSSLHTHTHACTHTRKLVHLVYPIPKFLDAKKKQQKLLLLFSETLKPIP